MLTLRGLRADALRTCSSEEEHWRILDYVVACVSGSVCRASAAESRGGSACVSCSILSNLDCFTSLTALCSILLQTRFTNKTQDPQSSACQAVKLSSLRYTSHSYCIILLSFYLFSR